jgi:hypothetical protein
MMDKEERDALIAQKLNEGMPLAELQRLLADDYDLRMTFLELRLIAADLSVDWQKQDKPKVAAPTETAAATELAADEDGDFAEADADGSDDAEDFANEADEAGEAGEGSGTRVTLDSQPRRGTSMSGSVRFASGLHGEWFMDQMGRPGLQLAEGQEGQPSEEDIMEFQSQLGALLQEMQDDLTREAAEGKTKINLSPVLRPGTVYGGDVTFASGAQGEWSVDQVGRLGFEPAEGSAKPTARDMQLFQLELQRVLQSKGL